MGFQKLNRKGLSFKNSFFAIVVVGLLASAVGVILLQNQSYYGFGVTSDLEGFNKVDDVSSISQGQQGKINADSTPGVDPESSTFRGVYGIITGLPSNFALVFGSDGMINSLTDRFGLPDYVYYGIVTLMFLAVIFAIIAIIFRLQGGQV